MAGYVATSETGASLEEEMQGEETSHDSCEWALGAFREAWGSAFAIVTVGQQIHFCANGQGEDV